MSCIIRRVSLLHCCISGYARSGDAVVVEAVDHGVHDLHFLIRRKGDERRTGTADGSAQGTGFDGLLEDQFAAGDERRR